jgi:hypothetical protein
VPESPWFAVALSYRASEFSYGLTDDAFHEDGGVDTGHPAVRGRHMAQDARRSFARLGVDRDHLAARVTLEDGEVQPVPDLERPPDQLVLPVRPVLRPVGIGGEVS